MVMYRRLDPLQNATPFQRLAKSPVKCWTLSEAEFERVRADRKPLFVTGGDFAVIGVPVGDRLEIHYGFPEVELFRDEFIEMCRRVIEASNSEEAPRGVLLSFRDRPNRVAAAQMLWALAFDQGDQWVEMNYIAPEQPEPSDELAGGYRVREVTDADRDAIADIEAAASGKQRLTSAGLDSLLARARWTRIVTDASGKPVGFIAMGSESGGWGIIQQTSILPEHAEALAEPVLDWTIAFLRNNGGRRVRKQVSIDAPAELASLRARGFTPGETGLEFTRPVDASEIASKVEERKAHGSWITFGDWR